MDLLIAILCIECRCMHIQIEVANMWPVVGYSKIFHAATHQLNRERGYK